MTKFMEYLQAHPNLIKRFVLGYIVLAACCAFPLWSENIPLNFIKVYLIVVFYGVIATSLAGMYGSGKEKMVYSKRLIKKQSVSTDRRVYI